MSPLKKIIKTSSAIGVVIGAAYYYLKKSYVRNMMPIDYPISNLLSVDSNNHLTMTTLMITKNLNALDELSTKICSEIQLVLPKESIRQTFKMSFLNKLNTITFPVPFHVQQTLKNLSTCTKNQEYLDKFLLYDGINLIKDVLSNDCIKDYINEEVEQILSELFANISLKPQVLQLIDSEVVSNLLDKWSGNINIILNLNDIKCRNNISQFKMSDSFDKTLFGPDIFLLDHSSFISSKKDFDVIFINGMLGSVFFTWRQHDDEVESEDKEKTKCWPRDWLSKALPNSRLIGINALLRPFVWNAMSNIDKLNRSIEDRAVDIRNKLELANVGSRPILWVTHSAGGILLKHILQLCDGKALAKATRSILFMSTPHSGAQSMLGLYYFPFKYFLTPEAKHLETNSMKLFELNSWFKEFTKEHNIDILTLTETEPTPINKFYSTLIVPKCDGEFDDGHEELNVKSNHLYISKPRNQSDQIYTALLEFITRTMVHTEPLLDNNN